MTDHKYSRGRANVLLLLLVRTGDGQTLAELRPAQPLVEAELVLWFWLTHDMFAPLHGINMYFIFSAIPVRKNAYHQAAFDAELFKFVLIELRCVLSTRNFQPLDLLSKCSPVLDSSRVCYHENSIQQTSLTCGKASAPVFTKVGIPDLCNRSATNFVSATSVPKKS